MQNNYADLKALSRDRNRNSLSHPLERPSWTSTPWKTVESNIAKIQDRIVKATLKRKSRKVRNLQRLLVRSFSARLKAVRQVAQKNASKTTPSIHGDLWKSPKCKYNASIQLLRRSKILPLVQVVHPLHHRCTPLFGRGKKLMEIPTMKDCVRQALWVMALNPVLESSSEPLCYRFGSHGGCWEAHAQIHRLLSKSNSPKWILVGDIQKSSNSKSEEWLLENTPMEKSVLHSWLEAGFLEKGDLFQKGKDLSLAPILWNYTLNGLQSIIWKQFPRRVEKGKGVERKGYRSSVQFLRYGKNFLVTGSSPRQLERVKTVIEEFLSSRGLQLNFKGLEERKETGIKHINDGFHFLQWAFQKTSNGFFIHKVSQNSIKNHSRMIRHTVKKSFGVPPEVLIRRLNPIVQHWCEYNRCCSNLWSAWNRCNQYLFRQLLKWCKNRHPHKSQFWIYKRYWKVQNGRKTFCAPSDPTFFKLVSYGR